MPVRHVMGLDARVLHAALGEHAGGVVRQVSNGLVGTQAVTLFESDLAMASSLLGTGFASFSQYLVLAGRDGLCLMFVEGDAPRLGFLERSFDPSFEGVPFELDELSRGLSLALCERGLCVGTAFATVANMLAPDLGLSAAAAERSFRLDGMSYVTAFADLARAYGQECATELSRRLDASRVVSLVEVGYLLVMTLERGTPYEVVLGEVEPLPHRHVVMCMAYGDNVVVADAEGMREMTNPQLAGLVEASCAPWYDGSMLVGVGRRGDGSGG